MIFCVHEYLLQASIHLLQVEQIFLARTNFKLHFLFTYPTPDLPTPLPSYHPPSSRSPSILSVRKNNEVTTSNFLIEFCQTIYPSLLTYPSLFIATLESILLFYTSYWHTRALFLLSTSLHLNNLSFVSLLLLFLPSSFCCLSPTPT